MIREQIIAKLQAAFSPSHLAVEDESYRHKGGALAQSHFKVILVSDAFAEQKSVARHREVYRILADELAASVHALALHLYTPQEWQQQQFTAPTSPDCQGG